jgi:hypothetical protein
LPQTVLLHLEAGCGRLNSHHASFITGTELFVDGGAAQV